MSRFHRSGRSPHSREDQPQAGSMRTRLLPTALRHLSQRPDSEHEQALLRVAIGTLIVLYLLVSSAVRGAIGEGGGALLAIALGFLGFAIALFVALCLRPGLSVPRRLLGMFADNATLSLFMIVGGEVAAPWYPIYLWVTFGNGFRYGRAYLFASGGMSLAGFAAVILATDYWRGESTLALGLLVGLLVLPAYVSTLLKKLTEARRNAEAASQAKSRFLANMSHEMRTPLNAVIGTTDLLLASPLDPAQREMAETARRSGRALLSLIDDILDISKIEAGRLQTEATDFALSELLATIRAIIAPQAAAKGLAFGIETAPGTPDALRGDLRRLQQVILNLAANAVKFTERGEVRIHVGGEQEAPDRLRLRIEVSDTGIGIAPELHDYIFTSFSQADETISRRFGGTGLGLAIAKQLTGLMGGEIGLESEPGRGSLFWLTVPLEVRSAAEGAAPAESAPAYVPRRKLSLLVADDNQTNRLVIQRILEHGGHHVTLVANGEQALAALDAQHFDLVLMDVNMPVMSGLDAAKLYRFASLGDTPVPIAALTADVTPEMRRLCEEAGMVACIPKPVETRRLLELVDKLAAGAEADPAAADGPVVNGPAEIGAAPIPEPSAGLAGSPILADAEAVLDEHALEMLAALGAGGSFLPRLVNDFIIDAAQLLDSAEEAVRRGDVGRFRDDMHALRSSAANMGAHRLHRSAQQLSGVTRDMLHANGAAWIARMRQEFGDARVALLRWVNVGERRTATAVGRACGN